AVGDVAQRGGGLVEWECSADMRNDAARGEVVHQFLFVPPYVLGGVRRETEELEAEDLDALDEHEIERDLRDHTRRVAHGHEATAPSKGPQRRLGEVATHRVDDDVGAVRQYPPERLPE